MPSCIIVLPEFTYLSFAVKSDFLRLFLGWLISGEKRKRKKKTCELMLTWLWLVSWGGGMGGRNFLFLQEQD